MVRGGLWESMEVLCDTLESPDVQFSHAASFRTVDGSHSSGGLESVEP